jgi:DNA-binding MarR family transcriptional regulator
MQRLRTSDDAYGVWKTMTQSPAQKTYRLIHDIYLFLDGGDRQVLSAFDLSNSQYRVLELLDAQEAKQLVTLSEQMFCARSTITRLIDVLEAKGLVHRVDDLKDRRTQNVTLTPEGVALRQAAGVALRHAFEYHLTTLDEAEQDFLLSSLQDLRNSLVTYFEHGAPAKEQLP